MIYRGPGLLAVVWFGSSFTPSPPPLPSISSTATHRQTEQEIQLADGKGDGVGEEPNHTTAGMVIYKSFNILCVTTYLVVMAGSQQMTQLVGQQPAHVGVKKILQHVAHSKWRLNTMITLSDATRDWDENGSKYYSDTHEKSFKKQNTSLLIFQLVLQRPRHYLFGFATKKTTSSSKSLGMLIIDRNQSLLQNCYQLVTKLLKDNRTK